MKEKIKEFSKSYLVGLILGIIVSGTIGVIAATYFPSKDVTYDNRESGLSSTDVQGAIDELYGICTTPSTAGDTILKKEPIVTSGDGLYKDEYEDRYFYKGKNVNNYVTFNDEKAGWRIISIEQDKSIKIMKRASIGGQAWDTINKDWTRPASLNTYLNETYLNSLSSTAQSQIIAKDFSIGAVTFDDTNLENTVNNENSSKWNGKIALPTASEYIRSNSDIDNCGTMNQLYEPNLCRKTTWMYNTNETFWTLTNSLSLRDDKVFYVYTTGCLEEGTVYARPDGVRPALYLSSEVKITGGDGSQSNPYTIM